MDVQLRRAGARQRCSIALRQTSFAQAQAAFTQAQARFNGTLKEGLGGIFWGGAASSTAVAALGPKIKKQLI